MGNLKIPEKSNDESGGDGGGGVSVLSVPERSRAAEVGIRGANVLNFLYAHFPRRWLDSNAEGTKRLFNGLFSCLLYANGFIDVLVRNGRTQTAIELLTELEDEYGISVSPNLDVSIRRGKIIAQKRAQDCPVTKKQLLEIFGALGVSAGIKNYHNEHRFEFSITANALGLPYGDILSLLDSNIRAHVDIAVSSDVETEIAEGIFIGTASWQSLLYENTALTRLYEFSYGTTVSVYAGGRTAQEINIETMGGGLEAIQASAFPVSALPSL